MTSEYLIARCGRCRAVWALDFEPDGCTCGGYRPHPDDDVRPIEANDYEAARDAFMSSRYPQASDGT